MAIGIAVQALEITDHFLVVGLQPQILKLLQGQGAGFVGIKFSQPTGAVCINFRLRDFTVSVGIIAFCHLRKHHVSGAVEAVSPDLVGGGRTTDGNDTCECQKGYLCTFLHGVLLRISICMKARRLGNGVSVETAHELFAMLASACLLALVLGGVLIEADQFTQQASQRLLG